MRIYFAGSIRGGREDAALYKQIIDHLRQFGKVLTEHIGDSGHIHLKGDTPADRYIHDRDMAWLSSSDVLVAEVTTASLGVGYEIGRAIEMKKKVLCLFRPESGKQLSAMVAGCPELELAYYRSREEAVTRISGFLRTIQPPKA